MNNIIRLSSAPPALAGRHDPCGRKPQLSAREEPNGRAIPGIIGVKGDGMEPTLSHSDQVSFDLGDNDVSSPGLYCIDEGRGLVVRRLQPIARTNPKRFTVIYDNDKYENYELSIEQITIAGRVVGAWRRV